MEYNGIENNMTVLTREKFDLALSNLSLSEAERELRENACIRTVKEILANAAGIDINNTSALEVLLKQKVLALDTAQKKSTVDKNVRNWMADDLESVKKPTAIKLAFALDLPLLKAEKLIMQLCGECIHWRDPNDLVYGFALNTGRSYKEARDLYIDLERKGVFNSMDHDASVFTESIEYDLLRITTPEDLERYLTEHREMLGKLHNTARSTLIEFLDCMKQPPDREYIEIFDEEKLLNNQNPAVSERRTVENIIEDELYGGIINNMGNASREKETNPLLSDALKRFIAKGWPEETQLSKMKTGDLDVTRKVLILLFLATDGATSIYSDWRCVSQEDAFEDRLSRLNTMLIDCGYPLVDPRSPFDWMVLYCLCGDDSYINDEKMRKFLSVIFAGETE